MMCAGKWHLSFRPQLVLRKFFFLKKGCGGIVLKYKMVNEKRMLSEEEIKALFHC